MDNMAVEICRASITLRNGTKLFAKDYGLKAFCFWVDEVKSTKDEATKKPSVLVEREQLN